MAGQKNLVYSEETPWFPEYYIGWIGIGNCGQKTSIIHVWYMSFDHNVAMFINLQRKFPGLRLLDTLRLFVFQLDIDFDPTVLLYKKSKVQQSYVLAITSTYNSNVDKKIVEALYQTQL